MLDSDYNDRAALSEFETVYNIDGEIPLRPLRSNVHGLHIQLLAR